MKIKNIINAMLICGLMGILLYAITHDIIIIQWPMAMVPTFKEIQTTPKSITLWYYKNDNWQCELSTILWTRNASENSFHIIERWLTAIYQEGIITKKVSVQSAMVCYKGITLYISCDRSLFDAQTSTTNKIILFESLLKTLRINGIAVQKVQLLVHHEPMHDAALDITVSWPLQGFMN